MNYISQLKGFKIARTQRPLGTNALALYFVMVEIANDAYFPDSLFISNFILQGASGLSDSSFKRARNELIQKHYIEYYKGAGNQAPRYKIVPLGDFGPQTDTQSGLQSNPQHDMQNEPQTAPQSGHINRPNKQDNNIYNNNAHEAFEAFEANIGTIRQAVAEDIQQLISRDNVEPGMIKAAIEDAARSSKGGPPNWRYVETIILRKMERGIKTLEAYRADAAKRAQSTPMGAAAPTAYQNDTVLRRLKQEGGW